MDRTTLKRTGPQHEGEGEDDESFEGHRPHHRRLQGHRRGLRRPSFKAWQNLPASIVMSPEDMVDAALVGLEQGELVTIPSLLEGGEWMRFEAARRVISKQFGHSKPASRYRVGAHSLA
jgi:hypothetical protein